MLLLLSCADETVRKAAPDTASDIDADTDTDTDADTDADTDSGADTDTWTLPTRPDTDHPGAVSWRYGGGVDYPDVVDPTWPVVSRVSDAVALSAALSVASTGSIVYVEDTAEIDLTGISLCVPAGVWLGSGRGFDGSAGALLYVTEGAPSSMIVACGDDVRVTGLRLRGPDPETCPPEWPDDCPLDVGGDPNCAYCTQTAYGISTTFDRLEVDNNELSGWTYAAVGVHDGVDADVHHNHIHHGWREGLGYGLVIYGQAATSALFRWNRLDAMRHAIAGQGYASEDYEARDNLMGEAAIGHIFDMHGQDEVADDGSPNAGGTVLVHGNIVLTADQYSLVVRGRPATGAWLYGNCLAPARSDAYVQRYFTGNFTVDEAPDGSAAANTYGQDAGDCGTLRWCIADAGIGPLAYGSASGTPVADLLVGDLDGDGADDVFDSDNGAWRFAAPDGGSWTALATSSAALEDLALADLDGDGTDDVFYANGTAWYVSTSGRASYAELATSDLRRDEVAFGDFDGDGADDVFATDGTRWSYRPRGSGSAVDLATSGVAIASLGFGDFDGDGVTDVFYGDGTRWRWSRSGAASWADLATSSATIADLRLADLDGDGITDVVSIADERLRVSWGGRTTWEVIRHVHTSLDDLRFGDWDGDGRDDVLWGGCL